MALDEAATRSYQEAVDHLRRHHALVVGKELLEKVTTLVGRCWIAEDEAEVERFKQTHQWPAAEVAEVEKCVVFADGVMVHTDDAWHEARVGTVVSSDRQSREHKSSTVRLRSLEEFELELQRKAWQMGYGQSVLRAFVADGSHWLWNMASRRFPGAVEVLDYWHLSEHVAACAAAWFGEGAAEAEQWRKNVCGHLWEGRPEEAFTAVEALRSRSPGRRQAKHELITYLSNNRRRLDYVRYRSLGLPCGSGEVEAQCKTLVQARCKQAGMRWSRSGVESLLRVRAAIKDGSFEHRLHRAESRLTYWRCKYERRAA